VELLGESNKTRQEGAHVGHRNGRTPGSSTALIIPQSQRPNFGWCTWQEFDIPVRQRISHQSDEVAKRIRFSITRSILSGD
jgi:hypothetical protein